MSVDITFNKRFTLNDVENKTSLMVERIGEKYWISKNDSSLYVRDYVDSQDHIDMLMKDGYKIKEVASVLYAIKGDEKRLLNIDKGMDNIVYGVTQYGLNKMHEILSELIFTFQTEFITCNEEEMILRDVDGLIDQDKLFSETTQRFGFVVEDGVIK